MEQDDCQKSGISGESISCGKMTRRVRSPRVFGLLMAISVALSVILLRNTGGLQFLELAVYDQFLRFQPQIDRPASRIVLVTIGETDIRNLGEWPLSDRTLARLLKTILSHRPAVVGLDIYRDIPVPPGSDELVEVISESRNIVTIRKLGDSTSPGVPPPYMLEEGRMTGFNDIIVDPDGVVRRGLLFLHEEDAAHYAFPLLVALVYLAEKQIAPQSDPDNPLLFRLGETTFVPLEGNDGGYVHADAGGYQFFLDFSGIRPGFPVLSVSAVLAEDFSPALIRDRIVLIGSTAESIKDFFFIPFSRSVETGRRISGVELHGGIVNQLLLSAEGTSRQMRFLPEYGEWLWILLWSLAGYLLALWARSFRRLVLMDMLAIAAVAGLTFIAFQQYWWIPAVPPAIGGFLTSALVIAAISYHERRERDLLMNLFACHVSADVAKAIWQDRDRFLAGGRPRSQQLTATVLFTDLRGFTSVAEDMEPRALMEWLNEYMDAMTRAVMACDGVVNKFIGDALMAVFGVPVARMNEEEIKLDAVNAVRCAVIMKETIARMNRDWSERGLPTVRMRVGIHTGPLVVGSLGSVRRQEYTVLGDTVNTAARLENYDKGFEPDSICRILIGEPTRKWIENLYQTRRVGAVSLKGKQQTVTVFQVIDDHDGPDTTEMIS